MHPCVCASFGTGCVSTTTRVFARGHDAKLRKLLVTAVCDGAELLRDGLPVDPAAVAAEFNLTAHVDHFVSLTLASRSLKASRLQQRQAESLTRDSRRQSALSLRSTRQRERELTRAKAQAARQKLIADARASTAAYLAGFSWSDSDESAE